MRRPVLLFAAAVFALAACSGGTPNGGASTNAEPSVSPSPVVHVTHEIDVSRDVAYMSEPEGGPGTSLLDVYYPKDEGPWPVVVMLHGGGVTKQDPSDLAAAAAKRGAVVFVPTWSRMSGETAKASTSRELRAKLGAAIGDVAAAVRFARGTATSYGGDPERLTLFGFSYGAMGATMDAFTGARPAKSGLRGEGSTIPESLVIFDGDYLNASLPDAAMARDPGLMDLTTPWKYLGQRVDFPITVINSGDLSLGRDVPDAWAKDSWLDVRDPSGELRRGLEQLGALENGFYFAEDGLKLFAERLREAGDTVTFVTLTDSQHTYQSEKDVETILDAIVPYPQP